MRKSHPAAGGKILSIEHFAALPGLDITSLHYDTTFLGRALAARKLVRRVAVSAPLLAAVEMLAASDMVSVLPRRMAEALARRHALIVRPLGIPQPAMQSAMTWPRRLDSQPGHRWLRALVAKTSSGVRQN